MLNVFDYNRELWGKNIPFQNYKRWVEENMHTYGRNFCFKNISIYTISKGQYLIGEYFTFLPFIDSCSLATE